jgi:hypothetical protein
VKRQRGIEEGCPAKGPPPRRRRLRQRGRRAREGGESSAKRTCEESARKVTKAAPKGRAKAAQRRPKKAPAKGAKSGAEKAARRRPKRRKRQQGASAPFPSFTTLRQRLKVPQRVGVLFGGARAPLAGEPVELACPAVYPVLTAMNFIAPARHIGTAPRRRFAAFSRLVCF